MSPGQPPLEAAKDVADRLVAARLSKAELRDEIARALCHQRRAMMDSFYREWAATEFARALANKLHRAEAKLAFALKQGRMEAR